jgi:hypothetical protein
LYISVAWICFKKSFLPNTLRLLPGNNLIISLAWRSFKKSLVINTRVQDYGNSIMVLIVLRGPALENRFHKYSVQDGPEGGASWRVVTVRPVC